MRLFFLFSDLFLATCAFLTSLRRHFHIHPPRGDEEAPFLGDRNVPRELKTEWKKVCFFKINQLDGDVLFGENAHLQQEADRSSV